jgi:serine/threonine protein kinase
LWAVPVALAAGVFALVVLTRSPAGVLTEQDAVLLAFENLTGDAAFDETIPLAMSVQLEQSPYLALLSAEEGGLERTRLTMANSKMGSPHYMAPEQIDGGTVDLRTDIYALGATAWHMLAGQPPLAGKTLSQIMSLKLTGEMEPVRTANHGSASFFGAGCSDAPPGPGSGRRLRGLLRR